MHRVASDLMLVYICAYRFRLNTRYGIIATPTVLLWVDGVPVARMDEAPFTVKAFRSYIEKCTDLEAIQAGIIAKKEGLIEMPDTSK